MGIEGTVVLLRYWSKENGRMYIGMICIGIASVDIDDLTIG